jgi:GT2 family glycosyltransferase
MGAISFTLDANLLHELKRHLPLTLFVESGTFRGESLALVQPLFDQCISLELSQKYYDDARKRFAHASNVRLVHSDSSQALGQIRDTYDHQSTLFWLDAHWCATEAAAAGSLSQCPLLDELRAIGRLRADSVILIDDARLFLSPPPKPHEISAWPSLDEILLQLRQLSDLHSLVCFNDVLIFFPTEIWLRLRPFLHEHTVNLLTLTDKARDYDTILIQAKEKDKEIRDKDRENGSLLVQVKQKDREIRDKDRQNDALLVQVKQKDQEIRDKDRANDTLLAQAKAKDRENDSLVAQARAKDRENSLLVAETQEKDRENDSLRAEISDEQKRMVTMEAVIQDLKRTCDERYDLIYKLTFIGERRVAKLKLATTAIGRARVGKYRRLINTRVKAWLEKRMPYRLGQFNQYQPRTIRPESFPQRSAPDNWPRICLITPSYQQAPFLERTLQSVLSQGYPNLAYGVQDGGSTDGSAEVIVRHLPRLAHAESAPDQGQADAIRKGFAKLYPGRNDVMAWLNSDDILMPGTLAYVGAYFARHPEVDVIYGHRVVIDEQDREIGRWYLPGYHQHTLKWFDLVPQETLFWRGSCFEDIGGMDPSFQFAMDWDLLLRLEQAGFNFRRVPYFLGCFRIHHQQKTSAQIQSVGEKEMDRLRLRIHSRTVQRWEIHEHLVAEELASDWVAWRSQFGSRA